MPYCPLCPYKKGTRGVFLSLTQESIFDLIAQSFLQTLQKINGNTTFDLNAGERVKTGFIYSHFAPKIWHSMSPSNQYQEGAHKKMYFNVLGYNFIVWTELDCSRYTHSFRRRKDAQKSKKTFTTFGWTDCLTRLCGAPLPPMLYALQRQKKILRIGVKQKLELIFCLAINL